jgi:hypothetical protein
MVRGALSADEGNRVTVPDIIVVISTSLYQPREVNPGEVLVRWFITFKNLHKSENLDRYLQLMFF